MKWLRSDEWTDYDESDCREGAWNNIEDEIENGQAKTVDD